LVGSFTIQSAHPRKGCVPEALLRDAGRPWDTRIRLEKQPGNGSFDGRYTTTLFGEDGGGCLFHLQDRGRDGLHLDIYPYFCEVSEPRSHLGCPDLPPGFVASEITLPAVDLSDPSAAIHGPGIITFLPYLPEPGQAPVLELSVQFDLRRASSPKLH